MDEIAALAPDVERAKIAVEHALGLYRSLNKKLERFIKEFGVKVE